VKVAELAQSFVKILSHSDDLVTEMLLSPGILSWVCQTRVKWGYSR